MNTLGELTTELDKKKISGENLDRIIEDLFIKYNTAKDAVDDIVSERFIMLNTCRNHKDLAITASIKSSNTKGFQNIPMFNND